MEVELTYEHLLSTLEYLDRNPEPCTLAQALGREPTTKEIEWHKKLVRDEAICGIFTGGL
jgi:hypothetical protein